MAYSKHTWSNGEVITADKMNNIEEGIAESCPILLWENYQDNFDAQTIQIDLSKYRFIDILCGFSNTSLSDAFMNRFVVGSTSQLNITKFNYDTATDVLHSLNGCYRDIAITVSSITFGNGQMTYDGRVYKDWNNRCIPIKIFGIK